MSIQGQKNVKKLTFEKIDIFYVSFTISFDILRMWMKEYAEYELNIDEGWIYLENKILLRKAGLCELLRLELMPGN